MKSCQTTYIYVTLYIENNIKLENQVVSLELAKQLKEAGYKQEGLWFYNSETMKLQLGFTCHTDKQGKMKWSIVAPTVAKLGEALPKNIGEYNFLEIGKDIDKKWWCVYRDISINDRNKSIKYLKRANAEANARAKMWLYLKKEGLL